MKTCVNSILLNIPLGMKIFVCYETKIVCIRIFGSTVLLLLLKLYGGI